jgi:hypothetical protein
MISAKIAQERSRNNSQAPIESVLAELQVWIEDACDKGEYSCRIPYPCELYMNYIRQEVFSTLRKEGYTYGTDESVAGCKYLVIKWEETTTQDYWNS